VVKDAGHVPGTIVEDLLPLTGASRQARRIVTAACVFWGLPRLVRAAAVVAGELVGNVIDHAHTMMRLEVSLRVSELYLEVYDGSAAPPVMRHDLGQSSERGRGLHLVAAFSTDWGFVMQEGGKTVWAVLDLNGPWDD
jgi:anti-sigma regulatory factor (Ser/Thr protein kinase)